MGFRFNGTTSQSQGLNVIKYNKPLLPPLTLSSYGVPSKAGSILNQYKMESRTIQVDCMFSATDWTSYESKIRTLALWLYTEGTAKQLILDEEPDKYYMATLSDVSDIEEGYLLGSITLTFTILDPFGHNIIGDTVNWTTGTSIVVSNTGTTKVYPVIEFTVQSGQLNPTIINTTNGSKISFGTALTVGNKITIDCNKGSVYINDVTVGNKYLTMDTDFINLSTGNNTLTFNYTISNPITIKFNKRYI